MDDWECSPSPSCSEEEVEAVRRVLFSNRVDYWTGTLYRDFETRFAEYMGAEYAVAVGNGTLALELALRGVGIGPGDEVVVTPRSFIASASRVIAVGATPVFAEIDRESQNLPADSIRPALTDGTRAVSCVHLAGWPCEMGEIMALSQERVFFVIEDCAQAPGATCRGRSVGPLGHLGAWSFCQDRIITTAGEGGMVTTNEKALWSRMLSYKEHEKPWEAVYERDHPPGFRRVHGSVGSNWRMMEIQAAVWLIQLERLPDWLRAGQENAMGLAGACRKIDCVRIPEPPPEPWALYTTDSMGSLIRTLWPHDGTVTGSRERSRRPACLASSGVALKFTGENVFVGRGWGEPEVAYVYFPKAR